MIGEIVAIGIIILIGLIFLQIEHHARKYKIAIIIIAVAILYFSIMGIFSSHEVDLSSPSGIIKTVYIYFGWIGQTASSLYDIGTDTVHLVGNAIKVNNTSQEEIPKR